MSNKDYGKLQEVIGRKFDNLEVLTAALTHKSYASALLDPQEYNERLEFLGDSVLSTVVVESLYNKFPHENEGKLSQLKAQIVSSHNLSLWAKEIALGDYVMLGKSEDTKESRQRENLLCDVFEAVCGAVFLDGGYAAAKIFISKFLDRQSEVVSTDYKSRLQEIIQSQYKELPRYETLREFGPDHEKNFEVAVYAKKKLLGKGAGHSKKEAQQAAAKEALEKTKRKGEN
ncbi:MAG: ribonuclease III [Endomicrobium sp.]|jgi:ribonuclease-3|nr:ribonuclease III [Endomicrobium sp.]